MIYRYFANEQGDIIGQAELNSLITFNLSEIWVDDERNLPMESWKIDVITLQLVEK